MIPWSGLPAIPRGVGAALDALRFKDAPGIPELSESEWTAVLAFCDRGHLTLPLAAAARLPESVRERAAGNLVRNCVRVSRLLETWDEVASALAAAAIPAVVLKGFTFWGDYIAAPELRLQYDIDIYTPHHARAAFDAIFDLGYNPIEELRDGPMDHLPPLVRQTGWRWSGDFFDPQIPFAVEVHHRLWDERTEGFSVPGLDAFWERRVERTTAGRRYLSLAPPDALGYAALHALRHLLRGDLRAGHIYELAWFLHHRREDDAFWREWAELHGPELRSLEAIVLRLAQEWFGCGMHAIPGREVRTLPGAIESWFARYAASPAVARFRPNKDELRLHWRLMTSRGDPWSAKARVLRRRLLPLRLPYVPEAAGGRLGHALGRARFHMRALSTICKISRR